IIITTALIPGKRAPILIMEDTVREMKRGSVIVDLASAGGGNCQMTEPGKTVTAHGVTVIGHTNLPATMPQDASRMYGKNVINFLKNMIKGANWEINFSDDIVAGTCIAHGGAVKNAMVQNLLGS
ncbi:MAG TPA: NAD(P)(+) transhydrogenase (Re/Si-specific) subunit alpha, partial [Leptospiraceae bacterium]|nr:NAD(P)(+) transhydrogenase (Re/Si-specific) subunit alpha [Leptospiraceae bacterium]